MAHSRDYYHVNFTGDRNVFTNRIRNRGTYRWCLVCRKKTPVTLDQFAKRDEPLCPRCQHSKEIL